MTQPAEQHLIDDVADNLPDPASLDKDALNIDADADELISQLADQQIEQLLAEANEDRPASDASPAGQSATSELEADVASVAASVQALAAEVESAAAPAPELDVDADLESVVDSVNAMSAELADETESTATETQEAAADDSTTTVDEAATPTDEIATPAEEAVSPIAPADEVAGQVAAATQDVAAVAADVVESAEEWTAAADAVSEAPAADSPEPSADASIDAADEIKEQVKDDVSEADLASAADAFAKELELDSTPDAADVDEETSAQAGSAAVAGEADELESAAAELAKELAADASLSSSTVEIGSAGKSKIARAATSSKLIAARSVLNAFRAINRPTEGLADDRRELIGSLAIITLVNAMSILLYVMLFH